MTMKKIRVAVIGVGYLGSLHAEKYAGIEGAELVGVADLDGPKAEEVAAKVRTKAYQNHKDLFGRVDAVSIATPTEHHLSVGMDFLSKGIDVLIEKPIAMDTDEARTLISESEKTGAILQVGHLERFNGAVTALDGRVSNPMFIESNRLSPFPDRSTDVDVILDLMIHDIDILLNLVGSEVRSVDAVGIPVVTEKVDIANARIKFANGCVANVTASRVSEERLRTMRLFQADAYISIDFAHQHISVSRTVHATDGGRSKVVKEELDIEKSDSLMEELKAFLKCSATRTTPLVSGTEGLVALEVATRIQDSVKASMSEFTRHLKVPSALD
jgi:predicted dehydrogenase